MNQAEFFPNQNFPNQTTPPSKENLAPVFLQPFIAIRTLTPKGHQPKRGFYDRNGFESKHPNPYPIPCELRQATAHPYV